MNFKELVNEKWHTIATYVSRIYIGNMEQIFHAILFTAVTVPTFTSAWNTFMKDGTVMSPAFGI